MSSENKPPANTAQFNVRLPAELKTRLENYAQLVDRPQANVACEALADYLDWRVPQIEALKRAITAADKGKLADRKSTRLNSSHNSESRMPSSA
jgi:predicted transcriptional regulator